ncbi:cytochrome b-c1 complex subunit 7 [Gilbertella persicaria]|uniref:cytochrome b-c1 complex subunit 7 n=1 Tax=Gilbertella persicaria TaxID=101096 RepID=UPI00221EFE00|nr:cytochrome b-c1 complex subunit 7 [Gilbertella persicaria]KAI8058956.1 cytochrome b-c1 complex subunit 7 [Gilbertella persicaria]
MSLTLKSLVQNSKLLSGFLKPVSKAYAGAAGYRQIGLRYDDLITEESEVVQEALRRLEIAEPREAYDRAYRIRVAQQCSLSHQLLPKNQWVTPAQDVRYLQPYIDEVAAERAEREAFDNIKVAARH